MGEQLVIERDHDAPSRPRRGIASLRSSTILLLVVGIEAAGGFVGEHEAGLRDEGAANGDALPFAL